jgi:multiple sugar transport system permease protein
LVNILTYAVLGFWAFVCLFPLYWVAVTSLKGEPEINRGPFYFPFIDFSPWFDAWAFILAASYDNLLLRYFNSAVVGLTSTLLTVLLGGMAVYGLTRFRYALPWTGLALVFLAAALAGSAFFVPAIGLRFFFALAIVLLLLLATRLDRPRTGPAQSRHLDRHLGHAHLAARNHCAADLHDGPIYGHAGYALRSHFHLHGI